MESVGIRNSTSSHLNCIHTVDTSFVSGKTDKGNSLNLTQPLCTCPHTVLYVGAGSSPSTSISSERQTGVDSSKIPTINTTSTSSPSVTVTTWGVVSVAYTCSDRVIIVNYHPNSRSFPPYSVFFTNYCNLNVLLLDLHVVHT